MDKKDMAIPPGRTSIRQPWAQQQRSPRCTFLLSLLGMLLAGLLTVACTNQLGQLRSAETAPKPRATLPLPTRTAVIPVETAQATAVPATMLSDLSTEEQLDLMVVPTRDLRDLTLRLDPAIREIPIIVNDSVPDYAVGDQLEFWVHNLDTNSNSLTTAELVYKTAVAYAWVEVGESYDAEALQRSIDRFSQHSYPAEVEFFGSEWYPGVDNDPRLHILHATNVGAAVAGYYSSADQYSQLANPFSNEKEMFYINLSWLNSTTDYEYYETVLAHEFQHMIHWFKDRNEETWLNEGLSEYAQEVAGYDSDTIFASSFMRTPDTQLTTWELSGGSNAEHYGSAYMFVNYLTQRFGQATTQAVIAQPGNGAQGITDALRATGHNLDFDELFADWVVANYVGDVDALGMDGFYGYRNLELPTPSTTDISLRDAMPYAATVQNYATDYITLPAQRALTLRFQGEAETRLTNTKPYSGRRSWWSHRGDDSNTRLTRRFDLRAVETESATPVTMEVAMWWNIEVDYDYGYVLASRDGEKWDLLPGERMTSENPSGNSFGIAYTGTSDGWVNERFDLTPYAGSEIWIRFEYVTDDAVNASGWLIDDLQIPAIDYQTDFESDLAGWESEGWLLTDNLLPQKWLVQLMRFADGELSEVQHLAVDDDGSGQAMLPPNQKLVLAISALAPLSTEPAAYQLEIQAAQ